MIETIVGVVLAAAGAYLLIGVLFSVPFAFKGAGKIDRNALVSGWGFKLLIIPGSIAFWPLLASRWRQATGEPPEEKNPHRVAACKLHAMQQGRTTE